MSGKTGIGRVAAIAGIITAAALVIAAGIGFATGGFVPGRHARGGWDVDERGTAPLDGVEVISVSATSENVKIVSGSGPAVEAWLHGKVSANSRDAVPTLVVERKGNRAEVRVEHGNAPVGISWGNLALEVSVPASYARGLEAATSSGEIDLADRAGTALALSATSGDVRIGAVQATDLTVKTSSGGLRIESVRATTVALSATSGDLKVGAVQAEGFTAHTGSGGITVDAVAARRSDLTATSGHIRAGAAGGEMRAGTSSGGISLAFSGQPTSVEVGATSGDVSVRLPASAQFSLDARATSGDIRCAFPITISGNATGERHAISGTVGTPAGTVRIRTSSGSIRLEKQ
jgi:lia operon protein LiaG